MGNKGGGEVGVQLMGFINSCWLLLIGCLGFIEREKGNGIDELADMSANK